MSAEGIEQEAPGFRSAPLLLAAPRRGFSQSKYVVSGLKEKADEGFTPAFLHAAETKP